MAETVSYGIGRRLDVKQILLEAQHRWLRPAEICEILRRYEKFHVSPQAPNKPVSGSVFLFDRKVLRYFRKDGHKWGKKKDGKTVKEAHEKLKVGSIDMLHCYYAHGEDNENFRRRSYWLLEQDLMHIVFVHYLEVKGNNTNTSHVRNIETDMSCSDNGMPLSSKIHGTSPASTISSAYDDTESVDNYQSSSRFHSYADSPLTDGCHASLSSYSDLLVHPGSQHLSSPSYTPFPPITSKGERTRGSFTSGSLGAVEFASWQKAYGIDTIEEIVRKREFAPVQANWQPSLEDRAIHLNSPTMNQNSMLKLCLVSASTLVEEKSLLPNQKNDVERSYTCSDQNTDLTQQSCLQMHLSDNELGNDVKSYMDNGVAVLGNENYSLFMKNSMISGLQAEESLKKVDSFSRWFANEIGEAEELHMKPANGGSSWSIMGVEDYSSLSGQLHQCIEPLSPSIPQDQLFSILDFSPNWAYASSPTKVLVTGTFLKSEQELKKYKWSIMFGDVEVPAEVLPDGILCCHAPPHKPGLVPFCITSSNRLACSEIREFEYRFEAAQNRNFNPMLTVINLQQRFERLICIGPVDSQVSLVENDFEKKNAVNHIITLMEEENREADKLESVNSMSQPSIEELLLGKQLKEKFYNWLLQQVTIEGKGSSVVDNEGQGVIHLAAALGFNWALQPIIVSGVSIDFRDINGWTALHWAALNGREQTVAALVSLGAAPGALTNPSAEYPTGKTPADLASASGHKGISGFLAETSLTSHLSSLEVNDLQKGVNPEDSAVKEIQTLSDRVAVPTTDKDVPDTLSLKDSLAAIYNATLAEARIHQIYRLQSFQKKQHSKLGCDNLSSDELAISLVTAKTSRSVYSDGIANVAATSIQKKFRGWRKRKEFLHLKRKVVRIQAHVRGHQVRKKYKPVIWSVGILEKAILRWRRKGKGLRGFRSDGIFKGHNTDSYLLEEEKDDFLKEGRKQAEERMKKALNRVKSMAQYPEGRAQYRRLLVSAEGFREIKDATDEIANNIEEDLFDVETLLDDDTFMSLALQ